MSDEPDKIALLYYDYSATKSRLYSRQWVAVHLVQTIWKREQVFSDFLVIDSRLSIMVLIKSIVIGASIKRTVKRLGNVGRRIEVRYKDSTKGDGGRRIQNILIIHS